MTPSSSLLLTVCASFNHLPRFAFVNEDNDDNDARTAASANTGAASGSSKMLARLCSGDQSETKREKTMVEPPINELSFGCHSNECQLPTVVGPRCACLHILLAVYQMLIDK